MAESEPDTRFSGIYKSGKYSDFAILCRDRRWKIHKAIVCPQWPALEAALDGDFKESRVGEYDLSANDPEVVNLMIHFFYRGTIPLGAATSPMENRPPLSSAEIVDRICREAPPYWTVDELTAHIERKQDKNDCEIVDVAHHTTMGRNLLRLIKVCHIADLSKVVSLYLLADYYNIPKLREPAKSKYEASLAELWNTASFVDSIRQIYEGTPDTDPIDDLRQLAVDAASFPAHVRELMAKKNFLSLFNDNVGFSRDLVLATVKWTDWLPNNQI